MRGSKVSFVFTATPHGLYFLSPWKKLSFMKPVPGAKKFGDCCCKAYWKIPLSYFFCNDLHSVGYLMHCFRKKKVFCCAWMVWSDKKENWLGDLGNYGRKVQLVTYSPWVMGYLVPASVVHVAALLDPQGFPATGGAGMQCWGRDPRTSPWLLLEIMDSRWSEAPV